MGRGVGGASRTGSGEAFGMTDSIFAQPLGLSRDPYWDDAWTDKYSNQYVLPHPDNPLVELRAGRASELGKTISNTFTLNRWHRRQVLKGAVMRRSVIARGAIALYDGLTKSALDLAFDDLANEAEDVAGSKEPAAIGTGFHKLTELYDAGKIALEEVPEPWDRDMLAYAEVLHRSGIVAVPEFTERIVWNRPINTAGRFDRLWRYLRHCDKWHVGDLKTGRFIDFGWHENPIQLQVYATATHIFDTEARTWAPMPEMCTDVGLILHVPSDGLKDENREPTGSRMAALYEVDLTSEILVSQFGLSDMGTSALSCTVSPMALAVAVQQWQKVKRIATLRVRVEVTPEGEVRDVPLSLAEQIDLTATRAELEVLWADAKARKEWMGHHTRRARERLEILAS